MLVNYAHNRQASMDITARQRLIREYLKTYSDSSETDSILSTAQTEQANNLTQEGLTPDSILAVELEALKALLPQLSKLEVVHGLVKETIESGRHVYLLGCGASGRMALIVQRFIALSAYPNSEKIKSVIAGGDVALVSSIEDFEDSIECCQNQLNAQGYTKGDAIIGFSASGAANFVLEAVRMAGLDGHALLVTNNNEALVKERCKNLQQTTLFYADYKGNVKVLAFETVSPALGGSTRMHPATIQFLICLGVLSYFDTDYLDYVKELGSVIDFIEQCLHADNATPPNRATSFNNPTPYLENLTRWIAYETHVYQNNNRIAYQIKHLNGHRTPACLAMSIFQDCTERSPTFNIPADGPSLNKPAPWSRVVLDCKNSALAWQYLLGDSIIDLELEQYPKTASSYRLACDYSEIGNAQWLSVDSASQVFPVGCDFKANCFAVSLNGSDMRFDMSDYSDFAQLIIVKIIMNTVSTSVMAKLGLCINNLMTNVKPANSKLLARSKAIIKSFPRRRESSACLSLKDSLLRGNDLLNSLIIEQFMLTAPNSIIQPVLNKMKFYQAIQPEASSYYIGTMSGTSMDGVDVSILKTDGKDDVAQIAHAYLPYSSDFHQQLRMLELQIHQAHGDLNHIDDDFKNKVVNELTRYHVKAIEKLIISSGLNKSDIKAIGCHGQTFYHRPEKFITHQLINADMMQNALKIPIVTEFRKLDVYLGGQGAPLAPIYHLALMNKLKKTPCVVINCGGIANATILPTSSFEDAISFDIGPGNVLLDRWIRVKTNFKESIDQDGRYSSKGVINEYFLDLCYKTACLQKDYLEKPYPKSLCASDFEFPKGFESLSIEDGAATLVAYTTGMISLSLDKFNIKTWVLAGGGWKNPEITSSLESKVGRASLIDINSLDIENDAVEADIFAYCSARQSLGLRTTNRKTTGVMSIV